MANINEIVKGIHKNENSNIVLGSTWLKDIKGAYNHVAKAMGIDPMDLTDGDKASIKTAFEDAQASEAPSKEKFVLNNSKLDEALHANNIRWNDVKAFWTICGVFAKETDVTNIIRDYFTEHYNLTPSADSVKLKLSIAKLHSAMEQKMEVMDSWKYDGNNDWKEVIHHIYEVMQIDNASEDAFGLAMRQWCWQIKRKWLALDTCNQLVVTFFSKKGQSGKSEFTHAIAKGLVPKCCWTDLKLDQIIDERNTNITSKNFIGVLEEWAYESHDAIVESGCRLSRNQYDSLKRFITDNDAHDSRQLGVKDEESVMSNTTLIGSSNTHFYNIIPRNEQTRRFVEFNVARSGANGDEMSKEQWATFRKWVVANMKTIAKSVDENNEYGYWMADEDYEDASDEITALQRGYEEAMMADDSVIGFITESEKNEAFGSYKELDSWQSFYATFTDHCKEQGINNRYVPQLSTFKSRVCDYYHITNTDNINEVVMKMGKVDNVSGDVKAPF